MKNTVFISILILLFPILAQGQELLDGQKRWSSNEKLTIDDFKIKTATNGDDAVYSQFLISHAVSGINFFKRNFNQNVKNIYVGNASWIDTTKTFNIARQINFQQMQFDLAEIAARKFRKQLLENKRNLNPEFINAINDRIISGFSEERLELIQATNSGRDNSQVAQWQEKIMQELKEMESFDYDNDKKIKLK